jgi:hypothetical protein
VGLGELQLEPRQFWDLTLREFYLKHAAFARAEDRDRAAQIDLALMLGHFKDADRHRLRRAANLLRRYPMKSWVMIDDDAEG